LTDFKIEPLPLLQLSSTHGIVKVVTGCYK